MLCSACKSSLIAKSHIVGTIYELPCWRCQNCYHQFVTSDQFKVIFRRCPKAYIDQSEITRTLHIPKDKFFRPLQET